MGKTTVIYAIYKILKSKGFVNRVLVIAPKNVCWNVWPTQVREWKEFRDLKVNVLHGKFKDHDLADLDADIYAINPEGLPWLTGAKEVGGKMTLDPKRMAYLKEHFDVLAVDESTKFKATNTQRFKILREFIKNFRRRYILTGTFSPNGLLDLFGQVYILDEGDSLGRWITGYKNKYFYPTDHLGYNLAPHSWAPEAIAKAIAPLCLVLDRKDHLDMPDLMFNNIIVELPPEARKQYKLMEDELVAMMAAGNIVAANTAVATSKCRQICQGGIYHEDHEWSDIHSEKLNALEDLIEAMSGEPLLIAFEFDFDLQKIQSRLNIPVYGRGSAKKDSELLEQFTAGKLPAMLGHPGAMSLGLNLQGSCSNMCWYGMTWKLQDYLQTIDRIYRQGQKNNVIVHRIIARDTLDERVLEVLDKKEKTQDSFLKLLESMRQRP